MKDRLFAAERFLRSTPAAAGLLAGLALLAYARSLGNTFVSDDLPSILRNTDLGNPLYIFRSPPALLRPLFYFLINLAFGREALFYRLLNILLHAGTVAAAYILVRLVCGRAVAFFAAALFAVHPLQTEAVAWISGGPYAQYGFFLVLSLLFWAMPEKKKSSYWLSVVSFACGLLTSEKAIAFVFILPLFDFCFHKRFASWKKMAPYLILAFFAGLAYLAGVKSRIAVLQHDYSQEIHFLNPLIQMPVAISSYLELFYWPSSLSLYHSEMRLTAFEYLLRLLVSLSFFALAAFSLIRMRGVFFWIALFTLSLAPTLMPLTLAWIVAERYAYLGTLGICACCAIALSRLSSTPKAKPFVYLAFFLVLALLFYRTQLRIADWKNEDTLWTATARISPSSPNAHNNLGDVYSRRGEFEKAIAEFLLATELNPRFADAYHNLANAYAKTGRLKEAAANYEKAIALNPMLWQSYQSLAVAYFESGQLSAAKEKTLRAIMLNPRESTLYSNLGIIYLKLGQKEKAIEALEQSLRLDSDNAYAKEVLRNIR